MRILIVRLSSIGDCVLSSPVAEALRERYPDAEIVWAVQAKSASVVQGLPALSNTILWDDTRRPYRRLAGALWRTRRAHFDVALDLHGLDKAGLFLAASGARRRLSGSASSRLALWFSTEQVREPAKGETHFNHSRESYLRRAAPLDIAPDAAQRFFPRVPVTALHRRFAEDFLGCAGFAVEHRLVGLNLGASHVSKRWPTERFAALADTLLREDARVRVVVFGSAGDAFLSEKFESELARLQQTQTKRTSPHREKMRADGTRNDGVLSPGDVWRGRVLTAVGRSNLMQMAALAERCDTFVSADTGPMHIAAAVGAPVLGLFGPTSPLHTGPVQNPDGAPIRVLDSVSLRGERAPSMEWLEVSEVLREVRSQIERNAAPALRLLNGTF